MSTSRKAGKGKLVTALKCIQGEQFKRFELKCQQEADLLEDIRTFTRQRASLDKSYAEGLLKLSSTYLNRKIPSIPEIKQDGDQKEWNVYSVWKTLLEENEKLAKARLAAVEIFNSEITEDVKLIRSNKIHASKKCLEQLQVMHKELQTCVAEVDKTRKAYMEEEHIAHEARGKAQDAEDKLKKKKGGFFSSKSSLQKSSAKLTSRREECEERATSSRNQYILQLAATNAHQTHFYDINLKKLVKIAEGGAYEKVAEYLSLMSRTELFTCQAHLTSYTKLRDMSHATTRDYNWKCYTKAYAVLGAPLQYEFDPCDGDKIRKVSGEHGCGMTLNKEAKKWATRIAKETKAIKEYSKRLNQYLQLQNQGHKMDPNEQGGPDLETKIEEMRQNTRKAETSRSKAEARLDALRAAGVNVDEWLKSADLETLGPMDLTRSTSQVSIRSDVSACEDQSQANDSLYDSDFDTASDASPLPPVNADAQRQSSIPSTSQQSEEEQQNETDYAADIARMEAIKAAQKDPLAMDWGEENSPEVHSVSESSQVITEVPAKETLPVVTTSISVKCIALYSYTAQNPDELSILENEELEIVGGDEAEGWVKARNYCGEEGLVPRNYVEAEGAPGMAAMMSFSSIDYSMPDEEEAVLPMVNGEVPHLTLDLAQQAGLWCIAEYDYEATCDDELSFYEGDMIKILRKKVRDDVDDGWWEGEFEGKVGLFPAVVVEECGPDGQPLSPEDEEMMSPPLSAPPVHTPPEAPPELAAPEKVIITQPTPDVTRAQAGEKSNPVVTYCYRSPNFEMELSKNQQLRYQEANKRDSGKASDGSEQESGEESPACDIPIISITQDPHKIPDDADEYLPMGSTPQEEKQDTQIVVTAPTPMVEQPSEAFKEEEEEEKPQKVPDPPSTGGEVIEVIEGTEEEPPPPPPPPPPPQDLDDDSDRGNADDSEGQLEDLELSEDDRPPPPPPAPADPPRQAFKPAPAAAADTDAAAKPVAADATAPPDSPEMTELPAELHPEQLRALETCKESDA